MTPVTTACPEAGSKSVRDKKKKRKICGQVETRVHAALAIPATLAALGATFQAFPALCPCEPRLPRGDMQAVPCGTRKH